MRRLTVALCALLLSMRAALGMPEPLDAATPPPCPAGDTFIFCLATCPAFPADWCLAFVGYPYNCRVEQPFCFTISQGGCGPEGSTQLWCPYTWVY